jgi:hypothetical protein
MIGALPADRFQREFRQFAVACARRVWHLLPDVAQAAVEGQERFLAGRASATEAEALLVTADRTAQTYYSGGRSPDARAYAESAIGLSPSRSVTLAQVLSVSSCAASAVACATADPQPDEDYDRVYDTARAAESAAQAELLRDILGNPFQPITLQASWLTWNSGAIPKAAAAAYEERALPSGHLDNARLAVLADMLEEAGCRDTDVLGHLRKVDCVHVRGCWCVDFLLGKT